MSLLIHNICQSPNGRCSPTKKTKQDINFYFILFKILFSSRRKAYHQHTIKIDPFSPLSYFLVYHIILLTYSNNLILFIVYLLLSRSLFFKLSWLMTPELKKPKQNNKEYCLITGVKSTFVSFSFKQCSFDCTGEK